jgi:hypothetical protein
MIERDYLMRMIAMLAAVIARVLHLKKSRDFPEAAKEITAATKSLFGADLRLLLAFSEAQLEELFGKDPESASVRWYILGCLLDEHRDVLLNTGEAGNAPDVAGKALYLLLSAFNLSEGPVEPGHEERIEALLSGETASDLTPPLLERLALYNEHRGRYASAEDYWWMLIDRQPAALPHVRAFYHRLLQQTDATLEHGGLPRTEVEEGLREILSS